MRLTAISVVNACIGISRSPPIELTGEPKEYSQLKSEISGGLTFNNGSWGGGLCDGGGARGSGVVFSLVGRLLYLAAEDSWRTFLPKTVPNNPIMEVQALVYLYQWVVKLEWGIPVAPAAPARADFPDSCASTPQDSFLKASLCLFLANKYARTKIPIVPTSAAKDAPRISSIFGGLALFIVGPQLLTGAACVSGVGEDVEDAVTVFSVTSVLNLVVTSVIVDRLTAMKAKA